MEIRVPFCRFALFPVVLSPSAFVASPRSWRPKWRALRRNIFLAQITKRNFRIFSPDGTQPMATLSAVKFTRFPNRYKEAKLNMLVIDI